MTQIRFVLAALLLVTLLFAGILVFLAIGRRLGLRSATDGGAKPLVGLGTVSNLVYAVLSLLLSFVFAGAASRFDVRRDLIAREVNAISTVWLRIDALPADRRDLVREEFRQYVDALIDLYVRPAALRSAEAARQHATLAAAQNELWTHAVTACLTPGGEPARMLLLPSINEMFDVVDSERVARQMHPAPVIWVMLAVSILAASLFAGYDMVGRGHSWLYTIGIAATISIVTFVIIDLEYPRLGIIRVDDFDRLIVQLRAGLH